MIVGFCGKAHAGKDTAAQVLLTTKSYRQLALAEPLKVAVQKMFNISDEFMYDKEKRELPIERFGGKSVRMRLQEVGRKMREVDPDVFVRTLCERFAEGYEMDGQEDFVITDIRFPNEVEYIKKRTEKFCLLKITRDGADGNVGIPGDVSEAHDLEADHTIENNDTEWKLWSKVIFHVEEFSKALPQKQHPAPHAPQQGS